MNNKILVLGNGPQINNIEFNRLDPNIKTLGVNRIWLKHTPDYFFFHDIAILKELDLNPSEKENLLSSSICFSSDWINRNRLNIPNRIKTYSRPNRSKFPDSVSTAVEIFGKNISPLHYSKYTFYLAGVNLNWQNPSHFWKTYDSDFLNTHDRSWYEIRFKRMFQNIRNLRSLGFNMISVTPDSNLNKLLRRENIHNLYS